MINTPKYHKHYILSGNFFSPFYFAFNFLSSRYSFSKCGDKFIPYLVLPLIKRDFAFWGFWLLIVYVGFLCCVTLRNFSIASNIISFFQLEKPHMVQTNLKPRIKSVFQKIKITGMKLRMVDCIKLIINSSTDIFSLGCLIDIFQFPRQSICTYLSTDFCL